MLRRVWVQAMVAALLWHGTARAQMPAGAGKSPETFVQGRRPGARAMVRAREQAAAMRVAASSAATGPTDFGAAWKAVGPAQIASLSYGKVTGRVSAIAVDPNDATGNTVYVGTLGGGVWKSTNAAGAAGSVSFSPLTDTLPVYSANAATAVLPSLSIGAGTVQPGGTGVVLAGTGDANDALDSYYGEGVLRSADGGLTWTLVAGSNDGTAGNHSFVGMGFAGFAWSAASPSVVVAAVAQSAGGSLVNADSAGNSVQGLYYSADAGATWQMATVLDGSQVVQRADQSFSASYAGNAAMAVVWNPARQMFYAAVRFHGYYQSADGVTWARMATQPAAGLTMSACPTSPGTQGSVGCPIFRGVLAVQSETGDMFALTTDENNVDQGLRQDVCAKSGSVCGNAAVSFGTLIGSSVMDDAGGVIASADYNMTMAAVPLSSGTDTLLLVGTRDVFRCTLSGGCVLRNVTNTANACNAPAMVGPFQHAMAAVGDSSQAIYFGNDSGIWRSLDGVALGTSVCTSDDANHFDNLNGGLGSLGEVVSFAQHPTDAGVLLAGFGANGSAATSGGASAWSQLSSGEGGTVAIDQSDPENWYVSTNQGVSVVHCAKGASCAASDFAVQPTIGPTQTANDGSLTDAPFLLDPALTSDLIVGTCRIWRGPGADGTQWVGSNAVSSILGGSGAKCVGTNAYIRSLAAGGSVSGATAAANAGSTVLYAGMAGANDGGGSLGGHVFMTAAADKATSSMAWIDVSLSMVTNDVVNAGRFNPAGFDVSSVVVDSHDVTGLTVYATVMGFGEPHVYRSVDGGGHWLNISSNLPDAPVNALVVDPNDANTVYMAGDTGVYATTAVTTCSSVNCWSVLGVGLPNAPAVGLAAAAGMDAGGGQLGMLRVGTYGRGIWQTPLLTAGGAQATMSFTPGSLTFAAQPVGSASTAQTITVTNTSSVALNVKNVAVSGDFLETDDCAGQSIAAGASCTVNVMFLPTATSSRSGVLTVFANVSGGQTTAALNGTGTAAASIVLSPLVAAFPSTNLGATSAVVNVTISNTSSSAMAIQTPVVTGDFAISANTCGATLSPQSGCTVSLVFKPSASGTRSGLLSVTDAQGTQSAALTGVGVALPTDVLSPLTLTFAAQAETTSSAPQVVTLVNSGDSALTLIAATITKGDFTATNNCGNSLNGHASCSISVAFVPRSLGAQTGTMTVTDALKTQTVVLNGTGVAPVGVSLSPVSPLDFGAVGVGATGQPQTITLTNNDGSPLNVTSFTVTGDFSVVSGTNNCPVGGTLAIGSSCTAQVVFAPTIAGARTGAVTVIDSAVNSPQILQFTGTGVDFSFYASGPTSATVASGGSATYAGLLSSAAGLSGTVVFTCAGLPANATCVVNPSNALLGGSTTLITITVATGVAAKNVAGRYAWMLLFAPMVFVRRRRAWGLLMLVGLMACGAGRQIPGSISQPGSSPVTPSGTYSIVVTGTSAGLSRSATYTLVVQ